MTVRIEYMVVVALAVFISAPVQPNSVREAVAIAQTLQVRYPDLKIIDVRPAPMPELYEVFTGSQILYTDVRANYLITGSLIDARTKINLTDAILDERNRIDFNSLPLQQAIVVTRGKGTRRLAVFTDPDCPYCRVLENELSKIDDVTVYSFLFPLSGIHPQAPARARSIWCADDRVRAWTEWMLEKKEPTGKECSGDPVDALQALGQRLYIIGTPTMYFENGRRVSQGMSAMDLEKALNEAKRAVSN